MKVLVTGGLGFIGSNFIDLALQEHPDWEIINVDRCDHCARTYNVSFQGARYKHILVDITNMSKMKKVFAESTPDLVVHFAAQSHVDRSFENTWDYVHDNIIGTYTILECVKDSGARLVHISTDEVYGEVEIDETSGTNSVLRPTNPYSATKASAELLVQAYGHSFKIPHIITRGNNVYGPKQYPEKVIPRFIQNMLNKRPCQIHGQGTSVRNFIFVDDVVRAILTVIDKGSNGAIYNIGTNNEYSVLDIFNILKSHIDPSATKIYVNDRLHNDKRYAVVSDPLKELGWSEKTDFETGIRQTIQWYKDHPGWFQ